MGPTIFISTSLLTQNPTLVNVALSVLANYVTDFFKGHLGEHTVSVNLVLESVTKHGEDEERSYKRVNLKGSVSDLNKLDIENIKKFVEE